MSLFLIIICVHFSLDFNLYGFVCINLTFNVKHCNSPSMVQQINLSFRSIIATIACVISTLYPLVDDFEKIYNRPVLVATRIL